MTRPAQPKASVPDDEARVFALVVGRLVASLRERQGWSQAELAGRAGLTQPTLSRIERGQVQADLLSFRRIGRAFGMSAPELHAHLERALARSEQAARGAVGQRSRRGSPWWKAALAVGGVGGLGGLVAFAVSAALDELAKQSPKGETPSPKGETGEPPR